MATQEEALAGVLAQLKEGKQRVSARRLTLLSNLSGPDLALFQSTWNALSATQRRELLGRLQELGEDSPELVYDPLFLLALRAPDKEARLTAIEGLAENRERSTIAPLLELLSQDPEEDVRAAAAQALAPFALMAELGELRPEPGLDLELALLAAARNAQETLEVRRRALEAVAAIDNSEVRSLIRQAYYQGEEKERASALYAMGRNLAPEWAPLLLEELESPSPELRYEAAVALGEMELQDAVEPLARALDDEDLQVQLGAISALGQIGGPDAKEALRGVLRHADERLREAAQEALAEQASAQEPLTLLVPFEEDAPEEDAPEKDN